MRQGNYPPPPPSSGNYNRFMRPNNLDSRNDIRKPNFDYKDSSRPQHSKAPYQKPFRNQKFYQTQEKRSFNKGKFYERDRDNRDYDKYEDRKQYRDIDNHKYKDQMRTVPRDNFGGNDKYIEKNRQYRRFDNMHFEQKDRYKGFNREQRFDQPKNFQKQGKRDYIFDKSRDKFKHFNTINQKDRYDTQRYQHRYITTQKEARFEHSGYRGREKDQFKDKGSQGYNQRFNDYSTGRQKIERYKDNSGQNERYSDYKNNFKQHSGVFKDRFIDYRNDAQNKNFKEYGHKRFDKFMQHKNKFIDRSSSKQQYQYRDRFKQFSSEKFNEFSSDKERFQGFKTRYNDHSERYKNYSGQRDRFREFNKDSERIKYNESNRSLQKDGYNKKYTQKDQDMIQKNSYKNYDKKDERFQQYQYKGYTKNKQDNYNYDRQRDNYKEATFQQRQDWRSKNKYQRNYKYNRTGQNKFGKHRDNDFKTTVLDFNIQYQKRQDQDYNNKYKKNDKFQYEKRRQDQSKEKRQKNQQNFYKQNEMQQQQVYKVKRQDKQYQNKYKRYPDQKNYHHKFQIQQSKDPFFQYKETKTQNKIQIQQINETTKMEIQESLNRNQIKRQAQYILQIPVQRKIVKQQKSSSIFVDAKQQLRLSNFKYQANLKDSINRPIPINYMTALLAKRYQQRKGKILPPSLSYLNRPGLYQQQYTKWITTPYESSVQDTQVKVFVYKRPKQIIQLDQKLKANIQQQQDLHLKNIKKMFNLVRLKHQSVKISKQLQQYKLRLKETVQGIQK